MISMRTEEEIKHELKNTENWLKMFDGQKAKELVLFAKALRWILGETPKDLKRRYAGNAGKK